MAKTRAYGIDVQLLAALETTYGSPPTSGFTRLSFKECSLGAERPLGYDPLLGQGRDAQDPYYESMTDTGDIAIPVDLRGVGYWLRGLFGAPVSTELDSGNIQHVFSSGSALPSFLFEIGHAALTAPRYYRHTGSKLNTFSFDMARTGEASANIGVIAQGEIEYSSPISSTPDSFALKRFSQGRGTIRLDGGQLANVTGGRFEFSNNVEAVETIRDDGLIDGADETEATANGSIDVRFSTDTGLVQAADNETPVILEYGFSMKNPEGEDYSLIFTMPRVFLPKKKNEIRGPGGLSASYDWRAARPVDGGAMLTVTLINDVEGY